MNRLGRLLRLRESLANNGVSLSIKETIALFRIIDNLRPSIDGRNKVSDLLDFSGYRGTLTIIQYKRLLKSIDDYHNDMGYSLPPP